MDNTWNVVYKLRRTHFNKKLCREAADIIENLARERDYYIEMYKDVKAELEYVKKILQATQKKLAEAEKYIKEHF